MPWRGRGFRAGIAAASLCVLVPTPNPGDASPSRASLPPEYAAAGRSSGVPAPLLAAIGYVDTRWAMPPDAAPGGGRGPMELAGARLRTAARLIGLPRSRLVRDRSANVLGGAALLRQLAGPRPAAGLDGWLPAVERLYGDDAARQIFQTLARGAGGRVGGTTYVLAPQ